MFMTRTGISTTHPDLASQAVDRNAAAITHAGSHNKLEWSCEDDTHPSWRAEVVQRVKLGSGCPYCSGRLPVPGINDLATTHPDLVDELVEPHLATTVGAGSAKKLMWKCVEDISHQNWTTAVRNRAQKKTKCPQCQGRTPGSRSKQLRPLVTDARPDLVLQAANPSDLDGKTIGSGVEIDWNCPDCKKPHTFSMAIRKRVAGQRCGIAAGTMIVAGVNDLATTHPQIAKQLLDQSLATMVSKGAMPYQEWICERGHVWSAPVYARVSGNGCPDCNEVGKSKPEAEIAEMLRTLLPTCTVEQHVKGVLPGRQELDLVVRGLAGQDLAVEYNGLFWHSEAMKKTTTYHRNKTRDANAAGLRLIHVWEDDWKERRVQVIRSIAHQTGSTDRLDKVLGADFDATMFERMMARKLTVADVDPSAARIFLNNNHIQGPVTASRHLGLHDKQGRLRALISLRSPRNSARQRRGPGEWEIVRYATLGVVAGGFTKLLAAAEKQMLAEGQQPTRWVSFSDDAVADGGMYETAGFTVDGKHRPDYQYVCAKNRWRRESKEKYQRTRFREDDDLLWDESWSEHQAALENGLYRIYDAGKTRWVKDV